MAQLPLTPESLTTLIGASATRALFLLPSRFHDAAGAEEARPHDIFVRRYSAATRPWIGFHADSAA